MLIDYHIEATDGQDWHFAVSGGASGASWQMDGLLDVDATQVAMNDGMFLHLGMRQGVLYVAAPDAGERNDHFIFVADASGGLRAAPWARRDS